MMQTDSPVTVRSVVFGEIENAASLIGQAVSSEQVSRTLYPALQNVSTATRHAAVREIGTVGAGLLDLDLADLLATAWRKYTALTQAARRTAEKPGREEIVDILGQSFIVESRPSVEVLVDEVRVARVDFRLRLEFEVKALSAVVRSGRIVALESGHCELTAAIAIEGIDVASRTAQFDLRLAVRIGDGIPLLPDARR